MQHIRKRLSSLANLARPLALTFIGIVLLSLGVAYFVTLIYRTVGFPPIFFYLTVQFLPLWVRGVLMFLLGSLALIAGIWRLSGVVVVSLEAQPGTEDELVLGYQRASGPPQITVISGGAGALIMASIGQHARRLTCITPVQDPVEYYYRASSLFNFEKVIFVVPTPEPLPVEVQLDDGTWLNIKHHISHDERLAPRHVADIRLAPPQPDQPPEVTRLTLDALAQADAIILGPGSLFESILPDLLIPQVREAIRSSKALKIYICSLMTEPGLTTGFDVADHIRQIKHFGGFTPDYVLVNAQRIDSDVRQIYAAANQSPVFLNPGDYEETMVSATDRVTRRDVIVEGAVVIESDLASSVVQLTASLDNPGQSRTVRVLRHDPDKLAGAIIGILRHR